MKAVGEKLGANARQGIEEVLVPVGTYQKLVDYEQRPALAYDVERLGEGALVAIRPLGHKSRYRRCPAGN